MVSIISFICSFCDSTVVHSRSWVVLISSQVVLLELWHVIAIYKCFSTQ